MDKSIEIQASSVELAVEQALAALGITEDMAEVEVLSKGGLLSKASVRVTVKDNTAKEMDAFINGVLSRMGLVSRAEVTEENDTVNVKITGSDSGAVIGYRGETLDAFQYLAMTFLNEHNAENKKVVVDCENYRDKRREALTALALRLAEKAVRLQRKIELEPMNPFERRVIHSALADGTVAKTQSEGDDLQRHIVIIPVGVELVNERPLKDGERGYERGGHGNGKQGKRDDRRGGGHNRKDGRNGYGKDGRRDDRYGDRRPKGDRPERKPRVEEPEVDDGNVYLGYFTKKDDFVKPTTQAGPPKFKSFGGKKKF